MIGLFLLALLFSRLWPVLLLLAAGLAAAAWFARGAGRALAVAAALVLGFGALLGGMAALDEYEAARRHVRLQAETVIEGVTFPAGTDVTWKDSSRTRLAEASLPRPATVLGVPTRRVIRDRSHWGDDWFVEPEGWQEIDGWPCASSAVRLDPKGALRQCSLSREVQWKGWTLLKGTEVRPRGPGHGLAFRSPGPGDSAFVGEIGRPLPFGSASLNEDGSLDGVEFSQGGPFVVRDTPLSGTVRWRYDAATLGEGRARPPVAVEGETRVAAPGGGGTGAGYERVAYERVVVRLSDGAVTREPEAASSR